MGNLLLFSGQPFSRPGALPPDNHFVLDSHAVDSASCAGQSQGFDKIASRSNKSLTSMDGLKVEMPPLGLHGGALRGQPGKFVNRLTVILDNNIVFYRDF